MSSLAKKGNAEKHPDDGNKGLAIEQDSSADALPVRVEIASQIGYVPRVRTESLSPYSKRRHLAETAASREGRGREGPKAAPGRPGGPPYAKGPREKDYDRRLPPSNARSRRRKQRRLADSYNGNDDRFRRSMSPYRPPTGGSNAIPKGPKSQDIADEFERPSSVSSADSRANEFASTEHTPDPYNHENEQTANASGYDELMTQEPASPNENFEDHAPPSPSPPPPPPTESRAERDAALMPPPNAPRGPRGDISALDAPQKPLPIDASKGKVRFSLSTGPKSKLPTGPRNQEFGLMRRALGTSSNSVPVAPRKHAGSSSTSHRDPPPPKQPAPPKQPERRVPPTPRVIISRKTPFDRLGLVGEGTYGQVYKAENWMTKQLVALKRVRMTAEKDGFPITAAREIKILQRLSKGKDNDKIIHLLDNMVEQNGFYMIFEYMDHDLTGILNHPTFRLNHSNIKDLAYQFFSGVAHIHRSGILHRDIKSSNILINSAGLLKIADFGLARQYDKLKSDQHYTNRIITLWYRPVEILLGETVYTTGPDVWSAGCVFMELFTRKAIFPGSNEISQLDYIWHVMGTPNPQTWPAWKQSAWYSMLRPEQRYESIFIPRFQHLVPMDALLLAKRIFTYDPNQRPTADEVLNDPYFTTNTPSAERTTTLQALDGEWHELESKKSRKKERERQSAAKQAKAQP
ncbi:hypothetical protein ABW20_dc0102195 [Dactylellina cionopaga]|nr:hypothetical protein ABW20_dc0102195 [Dactylellina cionopaga]